MLSGPRQLASAEQTFGYFILEYLARNDPTHRSANRWHGRGAGALGLPDRVGKRKFIAILEGRVPGTDIRLGRVVDGERQHRPGWDLTFSAPKSVSLEALLHGDRAVMRAHDQAVRATLDWVEAEFLQTRGYDPATGRRPREAADGMIAATFRHVASRNNDPQLHTHVVIANMTRNRKGEWRSVEPTLLKRNRRLIGAWYRNELARRLRERGHVLTPTTVGGLPGFELAGYSQAFLEAFSTRRQDILRHMEAEGWEYSAETAGRAALATRKRKDEPDRAVLTEMWREKAKALGLSRDPDAVRLGLKERKLTPEPPRFSALEAAWQAVEHLEERQCVFRPSDLLAAALGRDPGRHAHGDLQSALDGLERDGHLVRTKTGDLTTRRTLRAEKEIIARMWAGRGRAGALVHRETVDARLEEAGLTEGQREAVRGILLSSDSVVGVQGFAGTGKTRMLSEILDLAGDRPVFGLAPSSAAARVLAVESGIGTTTLQRLLVQYDRIAEGTASPEEVEVVRRKFEGAVVVVDESSMVGTVQMRSLLRIAEVLRFGRLVLVGDTLQLKSVEAGQHFRLLQKAGMETARMDDVLRQRSLDLKAAVTHMVAGDPQLAVESLGGDVRELPAEALAETAARLWLALPAASRAETVILAPTHAMREEINAVLRHGLAEEGELRGRSLEIERLVDRRLTRVLAADPESYRPGDVVVANRDVYGCVEGEAWTVTKSGADRVMLNRKGQAGGFRPSGNAARNVSVFETRPLSLRAGDRIVWTRNLRKRRIINGERATIKAIEGGRVRVRLDSGRGLSFAVDDDDLRHVDHAWSSTVHRAQGMTTDNVIAVLDSASLMTDRAMLYVEMSRARDGFVLLTDDTEELVHKLEQDHGRAPSALEATGTEPWVAPDRAETVTEKESLVPALDDWRALVTEAAEAGVSPFVLDGADALMARIRRRAARDPEMPEELNRSLADHEPFARDRTRTGRWANALEVSAGRRTRLLAEAQAGNSALADIPEIRSWRREANRIVVEGRRLLADGDRYGPHLERIGTARERLAELERTCRIDDEAAELLADWRAGERDHDDLAARTEAFVRDARPGEIPPELAAALRTHGERDRVETFRTTLAELADERRLLLAGTEHPVASHPGYGAWRRRVEAVVKCRPELVTAEFQDAVAAETDRFLAVIRQDGDVADLHNRWMRHREEAGRRSCHPFVLKGADALISDLADIPGDDCPPAFARILGDHARFLEERHGIRDLVAGAGDLVARRKTRLAAALEAGLLLSDTDGYDDWLRNADASLTDGLPFRVDSGRFDPHLDDDARTRLEANLAELERAVAFDRRAGRLLEAWAGEPLDHDLAEGVRQLEADARPGEMPPALAGALRDHDARERKCVADGYRRLLDAAAAERLQMLRNSAEPVAVAEDWQSWRNRVETALAGLEAMEPGAGGSEFAREFRDTIERDKNTAAVWTDWREHQAAADRAGVHPLAMPGHGPLMDRIAAIGSEPGNALECPPMLGEALRESRELELMIARAGILRDTLRRFGKRGAGRKVGDDVMRGTVAEVQDIVADDRLEGLLRPEDRAAMTRECGRIEAGIRTREQVRAIQADWRALETDARETGQSPFHRPGSADLVARIRGHDGRLPPELAAVKRESRAFERSSRKAGTLVDGIARCREDRRALLERAAGSRRAESPFRESGRRYTAWTRRVDRAVKAGNALLGGRNAERIHPETRAALEAGLDRIGKAADHDDLPPAFLRDWEAFTDRAAEVGGHRFFVPGYEDLCDRMAGLRAQTDATRSFIHKEIWEREWMRRMRDTLHEAERSAAKRQQERGGRGPEFVEADAYPNWRFHAEIWLQQADALLTKDRNAAAFFDRDPALRARLEDHRSLLADQLDRETPAWKVVEARRSQERQREIARQMATSRDRGFGMER